MNEFRSQMTYEEWLFRNHEECSHCGSYQAYGKTHCLNCYYRLRYSLFERFVLWLIGSPESGEE